MDADSGAPVQDVHFALHRQVTVNGVSTIDFNPMPGYEDLVTQANGLIPKIDNTLSAGVYELREKQAPDGFQKLSGYISFTVRSTGEVHLDAHPEGVTLNEAQGDDGTLTYELSIPNARRKKFRSGKQGRIMRLSPAARRLNCIKRRILTTAPNIRLIQRSPF